MAKPKLSDADLCRNAKRIRTGVAEIKTFLAVETRNKGFDAQDRPLVLFERHHFHRLTRGKFDESHPDLSNKVAGGYGTSASQYGRFSRAFQLDPQAAMKATSWGLGQVMGFNHLVAGYPTVDEFVEAMKESEGKQLDASINFIIHNNLDDDLRDHSWASFAKGYNGSGYKKNQYDKKLKDFYTKFSSQPQPDCSSLSAAQTPSRVDSDVNKVMPVSLANSNDPQSTAIPEPPSNEKVVVEKEEPMGFWAGIKLKMTAWWATIGGTATMRQYQSDFESFGVPMNVVKYAVFAVFGAFILWFLYYGLIFLWDKISKRWLTTELIKANASETNTVIVAPSDKLDELEAAGWTVIRRK
jgi:hypothetical protein